MEPDLELLASIFPNLSAQLRMALSNLHLAAARLVPAKDREQDTQLDARAALLDQSYYQLLRLVNSLTSAAYLGRNKQLALQNADLVAVVRNLFESVESLADMLGLELRLVCPKEQHICAIDRTALEQLLYQLLSNAFKFTPAGGIITVELKFQKERILLSVTDTGCGIPAEEMDTLFDRCLSSQTLSTPPQGLGLGLALCRSIAEGHGGIMLARSTVGKGSCFTLSLPDRLTDQVRMSDVSFDYTGGFNQALMQLADALPPEAFLLRNHL